MWYPIRELFIYPVKGCRALRLERAHAGPRGFAMDRRFMFVDEERRFITQRATPELARIDVELVGEGLRLMHPLAGSVEVPTPSAQAKELTVTVWRDNVRALVADLPTSWTRAALGVDARLVYQPERAKRAVDPRYARPHDVVSFADGFPYLVVNEASLHALNDRLVATGGPPIGIERFRPNIVLAGERAFEEDAWARLAVGGVEFEVAKPCTRCVVVNTDQQSGTRTPEALKALSALHRTADGVVFGQNAIVRGRGWLEVHDVVEINLREDST